MTKEEAKTILYGWLEPKDNKVVSSDDFSLDEINLADELAKLREKERKVKLPNLIDFWWVQEDKNGKRLVETKEHFVSAMKKAYSIGLSQREQSSLPSNLDEAAETIAEKYATKVFDKVDTHDHIDHNGRNECRALYSIGCIEGFKAGAKWMAEQFQKIEGELVDWYSTSDGKDYCCGISTNDAFEVPEGFYIRKKQ